MYSGSLARARAFQGLPRSAYVSKAEMQRLFFKANVSLHAHHFDIWWGSLDKTQELIKWTAFVDSISKGRARGRGPYTGADDAPKLDTMSFLLFPPLRVLRSCDSPAFFLVGVPAAMNGECALLRPLGRCARLNHRCWSNTAHAQSQCAWLWQFQPR